MLDKSIEHGKEHRKPYYRSGRYDRSCRPHGSCPWCLRNRMHSTLVRELACEDKEEEYKYGTSGIFISRFKWRRHNR